MEKWADFGIAKVEYNKERTHIIRVDVHEDKGDAIGQAVEWARTKVVSSIESGKTFATIIKNNEGKWNRGKVVRFITVKGTKYIRTDKNSTETDNLGKLPEF